MRLYDKIRYAGFDNIDKFMKMNGINVADISKFSDSRCLSILDINPLVHKYGIFKDKVPDNKSIADIVGIMNVSLNYDKTNVVNNLENYFSRSTPNANFCDLYDSRSNGMLNYSSSDIMKGLKLSFNSEPIVVGEIENGLCVITSNGLHRYHLLKVHYLNELVKYGNSSSNIKYLRDKYTIPVMNERVDLFKTYSNFLICNMFGNDNVVLSNEVDDKFHKTDDVIFDDGVSKKIFSDGDLYNYINDNIDRVNIDVNSFDYYYSNVSSFNSYINTFFLELCRNYDVKTFVK